MLALQFESLRARHLPAGSSAASCGIGAHRFAFRISNSHVNTDSPSRDAMRPSRAGTCAPKKQRAQGKPGASAHPQPRVQIKKAHERSHHRFAGTPGLPCAMVLTVSFVLAPVTGLSCHRRLQDHRLANLISASGYQAHTTSPSAYGRARLARQSVHRIPPNVRDDGQRPSYRAGRANL
jgi:hypothetical protein